MKSMSFFPRGVLIAATGVLAVAWSGTAHPQDNANSYYRDRVWDGFNGGEMNISSFIFRDMNANGEYDMGDRPFANVAVEVANPRRSLETVWSNISGFANFRASATRRDREIVNPGVHDFRVIAPPGWRISTGNQKQKVAMDLLLGSPGDLVASTPMDPVGLVQTPEIRGRVEIGDQSAPTTVTGSGPNAESTSVQVDDAGTFVIPASPGAWFVRIANSPAGSIGQRVELGQFPVVLPMRASKSETGEVDTPATVGFDDLISSESVAKIPNGYGELNWHNWVVTHNRTYGGEGYVNGTMSGEYVAYNGSGHPTSIDSGRPFHFIGGYFTGAWADAAGEMLTVRAWKGDILEHEDRIRLSAMGPVYFAANYRDITRMEFVTDHYWQVVVDDMVFALP